MKLRRLSASLLLAAIALPASAQRDTRPLAKACPNLTLRQVAAIENYKGQLPEYAIYARTYCVSVEEAARRIAISTDDSIGALAATLQEKEAGTFAGLWVQHQPDYRVMVAFTRDAAATLARYTKVPLFKPLNRPRTTMVELRATQERLTKEFAKRRISAMLFAMEYKGIVEVWLSQEAGPIRAAAARGEFPLPDHVVLIEPNPFPIAAPPPPSTGDKRVKSFPQFANRTDMEPRTLVGVPDMPAKLRLINGCLKLETEKSTLTALWQSSDALDLSDPARVTVLDRVSGIRVAAGEKIVLMGLQRGEERVPDQIVGKQGCPGPYRVVRGYLPRPYLPSQPARAPIIRPLTVPGSQLIITLRTRPDGTPSLTISPPASWQNTWEAGEDTHRHYFRGDGVSMTVEMWAPEPTWACRDTNCGLSSNIVDGGRAKLLRLNNPRSIHAFILRRGGASRQGISVWATCPTTESCRSVEKAIASIRTF